MRTDVYQLLVFSTIQPVVFVLLFRYVFGGAIRVTGVSYVDYLIPGVFTQTVVFGSMGTAVGLATDLNSGLLERFRSLPMARSAVLAGRTAADLARNVFVVALMATVGFAVGFRVQTNVPGFVAGLALVLLFGYTFSWVFATVGLMVRDPESARPRRSLCWRLWSSRRASSCPLTPCLGGYSCGLSISPSPSPLRRCGH